MPTDYLVSGTDLTAVADAIRTKSGGSSSLAFPTGFVSEVNGIQTGYPLDDVVMRNYGSGAVTLPDATAILTHSFFNNTAITSISAPNVVTFEYNGSTSGSTQGSYVFSGCTNLVSVSFPKLKSAGSGGYQFNNCTKLETVYVPLLEFVGQRMFTGCSSLATIVIPKAANMNGNGFQGCSNLQKCDLGNVARVHTSEFSNCSKLNTLILRCSSVPELSNINAFSNTPFASGKSGGTLYVPSSLVSTFTSATNWSTILGYANNQIKSIESTHTDQNAPIDLTLYYADGTTIPTS